MSNDNGNRTWEASPAWVTHSYPAGEHPAQPAPEPAPFWSEPSEPYTPPPLVHEAVSYGDYEIETTELVCSCGWSATGEVYEQDGSPAPELRAMWESHVARSAGLMGGVR